MLLSNAWTIAQNVSRVLDDVEGSVRDKIQEIKMRRHGLLCRLTAQAIKQGHLRHDLDIDQFVWEIFGISLSRHVSSRFLKAKDADKCAQTALAALLARARAEAVGKQKRPTQPKSKKA